MNIKEQRKAFETKCKLLKYNGDMTRHHIGNFYIDQTTNWMWQMWLSSANREGYKLVPVEPTDIEIESIKEKHWDMRGCQLCKSDYIDLYKAMIGACDDH